VVRHLLAIAEQTHFVGPLRELGRLWSGWSSEWSKIHSAHRTSSSVLGRLFRLAQNHTITVHDAASAEFADKEVWEHLVYGYWVLVSG
jgi:hypothetical protein